MGCCKSKAHKGRKSDFSPENLGEVENALRELIDTEKTYGGDMQYMVANYMDPLRSEQLFFDNTELMAYNSVLLDLNQVQSKFQQKLEKALENLAEPGKTPDTICKVSDAFVTSEADFEIYNRYILIMSKVQKIVSKSTGIEKIVAYFDAKFAEYKGSETPEKARYLTMQSILMKPFQRVMLYPLILERIEKKCQEGTIDRDQITKAIQAIKNVGARMNETIANEDKDEYQVMLNELGIIEYEYKKNHE